MKHIYLFFIGLIFINFLQAQNVGIGTPVPTSKLEVKNPIKSVLKVSTNSFNDTSQVIFSNRNSINEGTDMIISSNRESGLRFSSTSDLTNNIKDTILQVTPTGRVGVRNAAPLYPLDVSGDVNVTGELRANGAGGADGQFLRSNGDGTMSWASKERFKNFRIFRNDGSTTPTVTSSFTIPTGVTEIGVEIWGGGGQATSSGSGASGAYIYAVIPKGTFSAISTSVGAGGGCTGCGGSFLGVSSSVSVGGAFSLIARGGYNSGYVASQGTFSASGTYLPNISYYGIDGETTKYADHFIENSPSGYLITQRNAEGGSAPTRPGTGGRSGWRRTNWDGSSPVSIFGQRGSEPGGGGGFPDGDGGAGQIIIYW